MNISFDSCPQQFYLEVHRQFEAMVTQREAKKPRVPTAGLAKEWDDSTAVRDYLRDNPKEPLFHENFKVTVKGASCQYVSDILKAILFRSSGIEGVPQPPVRPLREQIALLYQKTSRTPVASEVISDSWYIRKLLTLVKNKAGKQLVSIVPHLKILNTTSKIWTNCFWIQDS